MLRLIGLVGWCLSQGVWAEDPAVLQAAQGVDPALSVMSADRLTLPGQPLIRPSLRVVPATRTETQVQAKPELWVLVSFSMSDASLKSLYQQLRPLQGTLVFRGMPAAGLADMQQRLKRLGILAEIDPWWFSQYQVTQVPVFILTLPVFHRGNEHPGDAVVLAGLLDVESALEYMQRNSGRAAVQQATHTLLQEWPHV